ncbi:uncharacterized protein N7515_009833 [Penicillium bovifimosum]|uniref:Uncharacterized protein n=1 Tax=Penicillium bovifimosum TaxID=126998 RepID=A0A9W9GHR0_9EURO|nr:uncharacterized protein N7515_009833 [Penicillium bovifimosum]KAJ5120445.1 hypothetical protein N7515_009833 [Penicillium bovifimosum]
MKLFQVARSIKRPFGPNNNHQLAIQLASRYLYQDLQYPPALTLALTLAEGKRCERRRFEIEHLEQSYMMERTTGQLASLALDDQFGDQFDDQFDDQPDGQWAVAGTKRPFDATRDLE